MHILFVCTGNTCRSPMAEAYFRYLIKKNDIKDITVSSAGTYAGNGESASPFAIKTLQKYEITLKEHKSSAIGREMIDKADLIIAMTASHRNRIGMICPEKLEKIKLLNEYNAGGDVGDPFGGGQDIYESCFNSMRAALDNLFDTLTNQKEV
jgi:protein-tyrosine phosphatase